MNEQTGSMLEALYRREDTSVRESGTQGDAREIESAMNAVESDIHEEQ